MTKKPKAKPKTAKKKAAKPAPVPPAPLPPGGQPVAVPVPGQDTELQGPQTQFVSADDIRELITRSEQDRRGRESAETEVQRLTSELQTAQDKLKAQRPVRFDEGRVREAAQATQFAVLMDLKGALMVLAMDSPEAAKALLRIQKLEAETGATVTATTVLLQRSKVLAERRRAGLEVTAEDLNDLLTQAEKLL